MSFVRLPPPTVRPGSPPRASSTQRLATPPRRATASPPRTAAPPPAVLPASGSKRNIVRSVAPSPPRGASLQPAELSAGKPSFSQRVISAPGSPPRAALLPQAVATATPPTPSRDTGLARNVTVAPVAKETLVSAVGTPSTAAAAAYPFSARELTVDVMFELEDANFLFYDMLCQEVDQSQRVQFDQLVRRGICHYMDCQRLGTTDEDVWVQIRPGVAHSLLLSYPGERRMPTIADAQWPLRVRVVVRCALRDSSEHIRAALERMSPAAFFDALRCYELWFGRAVDSSRYSILEGIPPETLVSGVAPRGRFSERHVSAREASAGYFAPGVQESPASRYPVAPSLLPATREANDTLPGSVPPPSSIYHRLAELAAGQQQHGERSPHRLGDSSIPTALVHRRDPSSPALRYPDTLPPHRDAERALPTFASSAPAYHSRGFEPRWEQQTERREAATEHAPHVDQNHYSQLQHRLDHPYDAEDVRYQRRDELRGNDDEHFANRGRHSEAQGDEDAPQTYRVHGRSHGRNETVVVRSSTSSQERQPAVYVSGDGTEYFVRVAKVVPKRTSHSSSQFY